MNLEGRRLLITGGTGSFGNAVLKRFLESNVGEILIFSRDEKKQEDMRIRFSSDRLKFVIGDVRDRESLRTALVGVDCVFHAAALKQVPTCEFYPEQAFLTNIVGAANVIAACKERGVKRAIMLSTDKAVYPINAMGMTKALMEKLVVANARMPGQATSGTTFCLTRYGNVMASRGSVIPLFVEQIQSGRQITITDPRMTRFLMSLEESVDLVMHAFACGSNGDLFVQKAPACTVAVLAEALLQIFRSDKGVKVIGTRHGEKVHEVLVSREELVKSEDMGRYFRVPADTRTLNYHQHEESGEPRLAQMEEYSSASTRQLDVGEVKSLLLGLDFIQGALRQPERRRPRHDEV